MSAIFAIVVFAAVVTQSSASKILFIMNVKEYTQKITQRMQNSFKYIVMVFFIIFDINVLTFLGTLLFATIVI